jgi:predicted ATP-grasp superfamily ATP-dependent carboligase
LSRQLSGDSAFGASGFRYCGNILSSVDDPQFDRGAALLDAAVRLARVVTSAFGLVGLNGVDFLARGSVPVLLEVNPRWSSSVELAERAFGRSFFQAHVDACAGVLPEFDLLSGLQRAGAVGKAIVYAREEGSIADSSHWLEDPDVRDVPRSGQRLQAGQPVCSVFASAADSRSCYRALVERAARIYSRLERGSRVRSGTAAG